MTLGYTHIYNHSYFFSAPHGIRELSWCHNLLLSGKRVGWPGESLETKTKDPMTDWQCVTITKEVYFGRTPSIFFINLLTFNLKYECMNNSLCVFQQFLGHLSLQHSSQDATLTPASHTPVSQLQVKRLLVLHPLLLYSFRHTIFFLCATTLSLKGRDSFKSFDIQYLWIGRNLLWLRSWTDYEICVLFCHSFTLKRCNAKWWPWKRPITHTSLN